MNRRLLVSIMIIGFVGAGVGVSTLAMFNDSEVSQGNEFSAGELDLRVDWEESYNGEQVETQELTNDPGAIFQLGDVKPGDHGEATVSLHLEDNPGWVWMNMDQTANWDNACTEPEREAEGQCGSEGELDEELEFTIWADDGDNVKQEDEKLLFNGTAAELEEQFGDEGLLLDGNPLTNETEPFSGEETGYIGIKYEIPLETGNHIQGDSLKYDISFYTEQRRHNDNPVSPWADSDNDTETPEQPEEPEEPVDDEDPNAEITSDLTVDVNESFTLSGADSTDDTGIESYNWDFGDGSTATGEEVTHSYTEEGTYTVELTVEDTAGNTDTASLTVEAVEDGSGGEEPAPIGNLTFNDQMVNEYGDVAINNASTDTGSAIFVTYEDGNETIIAAIENAPPGLDNFNYMVDIDQSGVPGEYTARMIEKPIAYAYNPGDVIQNDTLDDQYFSQSAQITPAEETEANFTATQGDTTVEITPIQGDETVQQFYDFRLPDNYDNQADRNATNGASYGTGPYYGSAGTEDIQQGDTSIMFLYEGPEGLSLVVVHEGEGSQDGGSATFEITDLNSNGEWVVKDDLYLNSDGTLASSNYDRWNTSSNPQTIDWTWGGGGSDGGAFMPLSDDFEFTIDPAFNEDSELYEQFYNGDVDEWQVISGNRNNPDRTTLDMDEEVTVTAN